MPERHRMVRVQHELVRRTVTVVSVENITPSMCRVVFEAESLKTFQSVGYDDHIKIFFPGSGETTVVGRDFTPRDFDLVKGQLTVDFVLHEGGTASTWVQHAKAGDTLEIGGPRGSLMVADDFDWYVLIGDETALPAIGRRLEELRPGVPVTTVIAVASEQERQAFATAAAWTPVWIIRDSLAVSDEQALRDALEGIQFPPGDGYIWLAGEPATVRALRSYLINERGHPAEWLRAAGYWKRGALGEHERM